MRRSRSVCVSSVLASLAFGLAVPLALPGCGGGGGGTEMVKPETAPAVSAKDSMNAYLQAHHQPKGKGVRRTIR